MEQENNVAIKDSNNDLRCRKCARELPSSHFRATRWGHRATICNDCIASKRLHARAVKNGGGGSYSDLDFDGKSLREVMDMMSRAKRWLEAQGCVIKLSGEYHETKIRKLKFE